MPAPDLFEKAVAHHQAGRLDDAVAGYRGVLSLDPEHAEANSNLGAALYGLGRLHEAEASCRHAIEIAPNHAMAHNNLGNVLRDLGRCDEAEANYRRAVAIAPEFADAHYNLGNVLRDVGRLEESALCSRRAVAIRPEFALAHNNLGDTLRELGQLAESAASCRRAVEIDPHLAVAHNNLGNALRALGRPDEAETSYRRALASSPEYAEAAYNLGNVLHDLGRPDEAEANWRQAVRLKPGFALAHRALGDMLRDGDRLEEAESCYRRALEIEPTVATVHINLGNVLYRQGRLVEAEASYGRAIEFEPDHVIAHWNRGVTLLQQGDFMQGFVEYEWRWKWQDFPSPRRSFAEPLWLGTPDLSGKSILLHAEQGLGDTIQFCRYASRVAALGARVTLAVPAALRPLMASLEGPERVVDLDDPVPDIDFHCPLLSLPLAFGTDLTTIPASGAYLRASPARVEHWRNRLGRTGRFRVGLVWSGSLTHPNDRHRSIPLADLTPLTALDAEFVALQNEVRDTDAAALAECRNLTTFFDALGDFGETAALAALMDVVIAVDTSAAHLAGALGRPLWLLLPWVADWRWMVDRHDSPWYPTATLFRQPRFGYWRGAIDAVVRELAAHIAGRTQCR